MALTCLIASMLSHHPMSTSFQSCLLVKLKSSCGTTTITARMTYFNGRRCSPMSTTSYALYDNLLPDMDPYGRRPIPWKTFAQSKGAYLLASADLRHPRSNLSMSWSLRWLSWFRNTLCSSYLDTHIVVSIVFTL